MRRLEQILAIYFTLLVLSPVLVTAQSADADLRNTIQNSVLADPRVSNIPPQQLQSLIDSLVAEAQAKGMTSADILSRPQHAAAGSTFNASAQQQNTACPPGWQGYLCDFNHIFGFEGNNYEVPIFLLILTAFLIAVVWELILHHRKHLAHPAP